MQHERVTNADRLLEDEIRGLLIEAPQITHLVASERELRPRRRRGFRRAEQRSQ